MFHSSTKSRRQLVLRAVCVRATLAADGKKSLHGKDYLEKKNESVSCREIKIYLHPEDPPETLRKRTHFLPFTPAQAARSQVMCGGGNAALMNRTHFCQIKIHLREA